MNIVTVRPSEVKAMKKHFCWTSPTKLGRPRRKHRNHSEMQRILQAIKTILQGEDGQITIRHLFYRLSSGLHLIPKTEPAYKGLCGHLSKWRRAGDVKWSAFADNTRWHIRRPTF